MCGRKRERKRGTKRLKTVGVSRSRRHEFVEPRCCSATSCGRGTRSSRSQERVRPRQHVRVHRKAKEGRSTRSWSRSRKRRGGIDRVSSRGWSEVRTRAGDEIGGGRFSGWTSSDAQQPRGLPARRVHGKALAPRLYDESVPRLSSKRRGTVSEGARPATILHVCTIPQMRGRQRRTDIAALGARRGASRRRGCRSSF